MYTNTRTAFARARRKQVKVLGRRRSKRGSLQLFAIFSVVPHSRPIIGFRLTGGTMTMRICVYTTGCTTEACVCARERDRERSRRRAREHAQEIEKAKSQPSKKNLSWWSVCCVDAVCWSKISVLDDGRYLIDVAFITSLGIV